MGVAVFSLVVRPARGLGAAGRCRLGTGRFKLGAGPFYLDRANPPGAGCTGFVSEPGAWILVLLP